jgi:hypothetical protein
MLETPHLDILPSEKNSDTQVTVHGIEYPERHIRTRMHGQRGNPRNRWTAKTASNNPGNLEANRDNRRFPILFQMRPGKDVIIIFRMIGPPL